jgi:hypothetical protein
MSDSDNVAAMQRELGRQLAALRHGAGLTQHGLAALAAQEAREARALAALAEAERHSGVRAGVTAVQECPHCGGEVAVLTTLIPQTGPEQEALRQQG